MFFQIIQPAEALRPYISRYVFVKAEGSTDTMGQQPGYESWTRNSVRQQRVMFSITWMFGQQQRTKYRKVGDLEELNRLGGGGGVQAGQ